MSTKRALVTILIGALVGLVGVTACGPRPTNSSPASQVQDYKGEHIKYSLPTGIDYNVEPYWADPEDGLRVWPWGCGPRWA